MKSTKVRGYLLNFRIYMACWCMSLQLCGTVLMSLYGDSGGSWVPSEVLQCNQLWGWYVHEVFLLGGPLFWDLDRSMTLTVCIDMIESSSSYAWWLKLLEKWHSISRPCLVLDHPWILATKSAYLEF